MLRLVENTKMTQETNLKIIALGLWSVENFDRVGTARNRLRKRVEEERVSLNPRERERERGNSKECIQMGLTIRGQLLKYS